MPTKSKIFPPKCDDCIHNEICAYSYTATLIIETINKSPILKNDGEKLHLDCGNFKKKEKYDEDVIRNTVKEKE